MKWSASWEGFYVEEGDTREAAAFGAGAGDVVFFNYPGNGGHIQDTSRPIGIRRKSKTEIESLNVAHAVAWQNWNPKVMLANAVPDLGDLKPGKVWHVKDQDHVSFMVRHKERTATGLQILQEAENRRIADQIVALGEILDERDQRDAYDAAMAALVGKPRQCELDISLPVDDREHMQVAEGCRDTDGYSHPKKVKTAVKPHAVKRPRRAPDGILTVAPQSGFCSSGVVYTAMPSD
jgi:hypothetical protein